MTVTIGSLFAGIGGLELGLEHALGARTIWQVERNPDCLAVLNHHWPGVPRYADITTTDPAHLARPLIICGGVPCQDASEAPHARRGAGIHGPRTGLWSHMHRIVGALRPRFVVVENVRGLIRRGLDVIVRDLTDDGYAVEATVIEAADVGAPHQRQRLFVLARDPDRDGEPVGPQHAQVARLPGASTALPGWTRALDAGVADGLPRGVDTARRSMLGNAVVPACSFIVGARIGEYLTLPIEPTKELP